MAQTSTLAMAKRLKGNIGDFQERVRKAKFPKDNMINYGHMFGAILCDISMIIEDIEKLEVTTHEESTHEVEK